MSGALGGNIADYHASGFNAYGLADWLGTTRFGSTSTRTKDGDWAVAPFGEEYAGAFNSYNTFTAFQTSDITSLLWDFPMREYHSSQGRWISPDPVGLTAVNLTNPQTWNRYGYVGGNPLSNIDPMGLFIACCNGVNITTDSLSGNGYDTTGGGGGDCLNPGCSGSLSARQDRGDDPGPPILKRQAANNGQVNCQTVLPNGQTVGDVVRQKRAQLQDIYNAVANSAYPEGLSGSLTGYFGYIASSNGPIDFKNNFKGQAKPVVLGQAGNFAYYAIGSGYLPTSELDAGATAYAIVSHGSLSSPAAQAVRSSALAANGCQ